MATMRRPFQGVYNIVRFNLHFYLLAFCIVAVLIFVPNYISTKYSIAFTVMAFGIVITTFISLIISWYVYDYSGLYRLDWIDKCLNVSPENIVNINAGFDEFSTIMQHKFPKAKLSVFDFYDALAQKEISIQRAQKAFPAYVSTEKIDLDKIPLKTQSCDLILLLLAAHEIRNDATRVCFFLELKRSLTTNGKIIVLEHTRGTFNFLAYTIGFFHFLSNQKWLKTFSGAGLEVSKTNKITPFLTLFILQKDGNSF